MNRRNSLFIAVLVLLLSSCTLNEADLFNMSASERINKPLTDNMSLLQSAKNGWVMEYFATETSPGYTLLMKFNTNGQVIVAGKNDLTMNYYITDSCFYRMIADDGPVLSFNTYNKVFHAFSNPVNPDGLGLGGDYEFIVMKSATNQLELLGKKHGAHILLSRLDETASWTQYFAEVEQMNNLLFGNSTQALKLKLPVADYSFSGGNSHVFSYLKIGADILNASSASFVVTPSGIRFQTGLHVGGFSVQTLNLNTDKSALVSVENSDFKLVGPDSLSTFFSQNTNLFLMDTTFMSPSLKVIVRRIVKSCIIYYNAEKVWMTMQYQPALKVFGLAVNFSIAKNKFIGSLSMRSTINSINQLTFGVGNVLDNNANEFLITLDGLSEFRNALAQQYNLSTSIPINPTIIRFEQAANAANWFTLDASVK